VIDALIDCYKFACDRFVGHDSYSGIKKRSSTNECATPDR